MRSAFKVVVDPFCFRQFDPTNKTSSFIDVPKEEFERKVNEIYKEELLQPGYADFCKHIFIENFTSATLGYAEVTKDNEHLLRTCYEARTEKELPVLKRFFPEGSVPSVRAQFLDIILYSKDQIQKENEAMGNTDPNKDISYDYGIVSIKPQSISSEITMDPITMIRNALGVDQGGSGVKLERELYLKSVEFWSKHALIKKI